MGGLAPDESGLTGLLLSSVILFVTGFFRQSQPPDLAPVLSRPSPKGLFAGTPEQEMKA